MAHNRVEVTISEKSDVEVTDTTIEIVVTFENVKLMMDRKTAEHWLEKLENTLIEEDKQRSTLGNKIEGLEEKISDLENEILATKETEIHQFWN